MRQIKCRAWDGVKMHEVYQIQMRKSGIVAYTLTNGRFTKIENCQILESTGLKDSSGEEIFEGYIIEVKPEWYRGGLAAGPSGDEEMKISKPQYLVTWCEEVAGFMAKKVAHVIYDFPDRGTYLWLSAYEGSGCKIIGNKFENPELLSLSPQN